MIGLSVWVQTICNMHQSTFDLTLDQITKIEGHAALHIKVVEGKVTECKFSIPEYKRFYTQAIQGKPIVALPQMVSRICGTCSNAHLLSSIKAIEMSQGIEPSHQTYLLRRLLTNALMIRDHALHLYIFVLPDLYGHDSILEFRDDNAEEHELVHDAFAIKEAGNQLAIWSGGRSVHAPMPTVGGFLKLPIEGRQPQLLEQLQEIRGRVLRIIDVFKNSSFIQVEDVSFSALINDQYDFITGRIVSAEQDQVPADQYGDYLKHVVIPYSQASGYTFKGKVFIVGAIARLNLSKDQLHSHTKKDAASALALFPSKNIFHNNLAQAIEILHCIDDSIDILSSLKIQPEKPITYKVRAGIGTGVIEAPRGTLYHRYEVDEKGVVTKGNIIVPTGQNQISIEKSLLHFAERFHTMPHKMLSHEFEKIVRSYDPCMSCASHFLKLKITRK